ncbi:hypothetical protein BK143_01195 [Paenibacillus peoriae]|nr:hypothetical protein BK143_01195 [Paenibacillus peoriae]
MSYSLKSIYLNDATQYKFINGNDDKELDNLSKINIFLGSNNSGKSQLMRKIVKEETLNFTPSNFELQDLSNFHDDLFRSLERVFNDRSIKDYGGLKQRLINMKKYVFIPEGLDFIEAYQEFISDLSNIKAGSSINSDYSFTNFNFDSLDKQLKNTGNDYKEKLDRLTAGKMTHYDFKRLYIPTLRGLRTLVNTGNDVYSERTIKDYFPNFKGDTFFTGLNLYEELKNLLLGGLKEREKISQYQKFLGDTFFNGSKLALIPSVNSDVVTVKIGDEQELPIFNLGDGIQSIIIQTFPLFAHMGKRMLVFIEEPELYLHPGLQRKLLETFMRDEFKDFQFFFTTHSNHILDITLDITQISIYALKKELEGSDSNEKNASFIVENVSNEDNSLLEMLGVQNSSVYLSNCTIWVEGITDRYYIRRYLKLYQDYLGIAQKDRFKEDYHYSFVEYSGNNITHWSFLDDNNDEEFGTMNVERLCSKLFLITDKDSDKKLPRQEKLQKNLGDRYYCLESKEIENLLEPEIIKQVIADYEKVKPSALIFNKNFTRKTYLNRYLGKFIDDTLENSKRATNYGSASGTIRDKVKFSEKSLKYLANYDDMSDEAKDLAQKVYTFIQQNNKNSL